MQILEVCFAAMFGAATLSAQSGAPLQSFREEFVADPAALSTTDMPADIAEAVASGALELRQQVAYDAPAGQLVIRTFGVAPGSPPMTPMAAIQNMQLEKYKVDVVEVHAIGDWIRFTGVVAAGTRAPICRAVEGATYVFRTNFSGGDTAFFYNTVATLEGTSAQYAAEGAGLVEIGTEANRAPVVVVPEFLETASPEVRIDASASYDPDGDEIDFKWRVPVGAASLRGCETPAATLQLSQGAGVYEAEVLVTDGKGASSTALIRIYYAGR